MASVESMLKGAAMRAVLIEHLNNKRDAVLNQFCRKLLGYSLGRAVMLSDKPLLTEIQAQLRSHDFHFSTAVETIVRSKQFREIRGTEGVGE